MSGVRKNISRDYTSDFLNKLQNMKNSKSDVNSSKTKALSCNNCFKLAIICHIFYLIKRKLIVYILVYKHINQIWFINYQNIVNQHLNAENSVILMEKSSLQKLGLISPQKVDLQNSKSKLNI